MKNRLWHAIAVLSVAAIAGCDDDRAPQPPQIYFGQTECDQCRMIISDERFAAALVHVDDHGRYQSLKFDDIGCLLQTEAEQSNLHVAARFVRDEQSKSWLSAESAVYLHSKAVQTPMAFHVAAYASSDLAEQGRLKFAGQILDFQGVRERFSAGTLRDF